jgi:hypothetical protein
MNTFLRRIAAMLALAIAILFTLTGILAALAIADSALKARHAYAQLLREAALMQSGFAVQVEAQELRVRRAPARVMPLRRLSALRMQAVPACVAA